MPRRNPFSKSALARYDGGEFGVVSEDVAVALADRLELSQRM
jgi:hypothetical protein